MSTIMNLRTKKVFPIETISYPFNKENRDEQVVILPSSQQPCPIVFGDIYEVKNISNLEPHYNFNIYLRPYDSKVIQDMGTRRGRLWVYFNLVDNLEAMKFVGEL